jgi:cullin 3
MYGFENFINMNEKTAKALVMYLDEQFKKDFKNNTEQEISDKVDKVVQIFRYLQDKDIFESFYKNFFAKRLLDSRRVLEDAEKEVIKKLKEECGFNFTQRLEVMFRDITMSDQRMNDFKKSHLSHQVPFELNVKVLTTGHWPNESRDAQQIASQ